MWIQHKHRIVKTIFVILTLQRYKFRRRFLYFPFYYNDTESINSQIINNFKHLTGIESKINSKGYLKNKGEIFVEIDNFDKSIQKDNHYIWCLPDEILNKRKIYNIDIHNSVYNLFISNSELLYVMDKNNEPYESPTTLYTENDYNVSSFNSFLV